MTFETDSHRLLGQVRALGIKRLFLDGLGGFERAAVYRPRLVEFFASLMDQLRYLGVTTMATWEIREMVGADVAAPARDISAILDNMILLRQIEEDHHLIRSISVQKMRDSDFDSAAYGIAFGQGGLKVGQGLGADIATAISHPVTG